MLSPRLLEILRTYWHDAHPREWLFPGNIPERPISRDAVGQACQLARKRSGIQKHDFDDNMGKMVTVRACLGKSATAKRAAAETVKMPDGRTLRVGSDYEHGEN